ncbi:MAG: twin-arginine translocase subunit TatC [Planctomycetes bacterium]|nr:twin-arginine translocase subunit TatC [Planctomycetota bacterium]
MADPDPEERAFESTRMSLAEHLVELRKRLFRGVLALIVAFFVGWAYYEPLSEILLSPLRATTSFIDSAQVKRYEEVLAADPTIPRTRYFRTSDAEDKRLWAEFTIEQRPIVTGIGEGFFFSMRVSLAFALAAGGPVLLYQLWQFIAAGLYPRERRLVLSYFPISVLLFASGVVFGAMYLLPFCMQQLALAFPTEMVGAQFTLEEYWSFFATLSLALGAVFQLPVIMHALVHVDLVSRQAFARYRGHFVLFTLVFGGIITPPDPYSQFLVAVPMILLYEVGLLAAWPLTRRREREARQREREQDAR